MKYIVEIFKDGRWEFFSDHNGLDYAEVSREVKSSSVLARVTYCGEVVIDEKGETILGGNTRQ